MFGISKRMCGIFFSFLLCLCSFIITNCFAQSRISIRQLKDGFNQTDPEKVCKIHGWVSSERRVDSADLRGYWLKDRYGEFILVKTTKSLPEPNKELDVTGVPQWDSKQKIIWKDNTLFC